VAVSTKDIRNIILIAHSQTGKTTLVENLLFKGGAISKKGSVDAGTTISDYSTDEKARKNSINMSLAFYEQDGVKVNLIDAPGFLDYAGDVVAGLSAADAAILMVDSVAGIETGTNKYWKRAEALNIPVLIVVNKMDKDNADFAKVLEAIQARFGKKCAALCYPNGAGSSFSSLAINPDEHIGKETTADVRRYHTKKE